LNTATSTPPPAAKLAWINDGEWDTELAAVWYAANFYYGASAKRRIEYAGIVFRKQNGKYGITVRNGFRDKNGKIRSNEFDGALVRFRDTPGGAVPVAVWHTHLPETLRVGPVAGGILELFGELLGGIDEDLGMSYQHFSGKDRDIADNATKQSLRLWGSRISIYLVTADMIKRYRPGVKKPIEFWHKKPPAHL
jgi:hypothetical protein